MSLTLYNTLTRRKEAFEPIDPAHVRMYVCGPTVYDFAHIGNARPVIVFDLLYRMLRHEYGADHVTYVRNITDVDDKINARAADEGVSIRKLTERTTAQFHADIAALGVLPPTHEPRATEHIAGMIDIIGKLIERGHAYVAEGHVLFHVPSMKGYGKLSGRSLDEMVAGARVEVAPYKKDAMDFVLWKPSPAELPGWESPWGRGRPGWHIECSAMSAAHLGERFDIHGGGIDLIFPHHENEIAQSRCAFGTDVMANVWMHNGFLQVEGQKMSKSLGNFVTIHELLHTSKFGGRSWAGDVLRLAMLRTHYRQPIDWTVASLEEAEQTWVSYGNIIRDVSASSPDESFMAALADDLNLPAALAALRTVRNSAAHGDLEAARRLRASLEFLGLYRSFGLNFSFSVTISKSGLSPSGIVDSIGPLNGDIELAAISNSIAKHGQWANEAVEWLGKFIPGTTVRDFRKVKDVWEKIVELDGLRQLARLEKNWTRSDELRDELLALGIVVQDSKLGSTWEVKR